MPTGVQHSFPKANSEFAYSLAKERRALFRAHWLILYPGSTVTPQTVPGHRHQGIGHLRASEKKAGIPLWPVPTASFTAWTWLSCLFLGEISSSLKQQWQRKRTPRLGPFSEGSQADPVGYHHTLH